MVNSMIIGWKVLDSIPSGWNIRGCHDPLLFIVGYRGPQSVPKSGDFPNYSQCGPTKRRYIPPPPPRGGGGGVGGSPLPLEAPKPPPPPLVPQRRGHSGVVPSGPPRLRRL